MYNGRSEKPCILRLQEISQRDFCDHIEDNNFFLVYGNPVVIRCDDGFKVVAIAWPLAERIMCATGRGDEADAINKLAAQKAGTEGNGGILGVRTFIHRTE